MKTVSKYKLAKRLGPSIFEKTQSQKFALSAERSAKNKRGGRGRGASEFGKQLLEKQKVRVTYGLSERQFSNYVEAAMSAKGKSPVEALHESLELRLDNVVYRIGLAPTRRAARQMVSHGHITVDGVKTTIPSRRVYPGEVLAVRDGSKDAGLYASFADKFAERPLPSWLSFDAKAMKGGVVALPTAESAGPAGDLVTVISFYSR
jgi:small subunit ribosomal protein S4